MRRKERWQRRKLKAEIGALTEQADAYEDTLMIFAVRKHESDKETPCCWVESWRSSAFRELADWRGQLQ